MTSGEQRPRRPGRRPGANATRESILAAARDAFAAHGYEKSTIRGIARRAGVDPALVHHFFGAKEEVFMAAVGDVLAPIAEAMEGTGADADPGAAAARLASTIVALWEREPTKGALLGALRAAVTSETAAALVRRIVQEHTVAAIAAGTGGPDAELRANLVGATVVGIALVRHVLEVEPIASLDERRLASVLTAAFAYYLDDEPADPDSGAAAATGSRADAAR